MPRTQIDSLLDSVTAINNAIANADAKPDSVRNTLVANVGHIELCLKKTDYTSKLAAEQTKTLTDAVAAAKAKIATLPAVTASARANKNQGDKTAKLAAAKKATK